eukprot:tig00021374_g21098.t1
MRILSGRLQLAARPSVKLLLTVPFSRLQPDVDFQAHPAALEALYRETHRLLGASAALLAQCTAAASYSAAHPAAGGAGAVANADAPNSGEGASSASLFSTSATAACAASAGVGVRSLSVKLDVWGLRLEAIPRAAVSGLVLGTLSALRPPPLSAGAPPPAAADAAAAPAPAPAPAPAALTELTLDIDDGHAHGVSGRSEWWPSPQELAPALAPFGLLRSFSLFPSPVAPCIVDGPAAAAIVQCCPLLRSVLFRPADGAAVAALAPLAFLEEVTLTSEFTDEEEGRELDLHVCGGPEALGAGPAGRSLRTFSAKRSALVSGADLCGFGSMPRLESLEGIEIDEERTPIAREDAAAIRGARRLRRLGARLYASEAQRTSNFLLGLSDALGPCSDPPALCIDIQGSSCSPDPETLTHFFSHASRSLQTFQSRLERPFTDAEVGSLLRHGTALQTLRLCVSIQALSDLYPLQGLQGLQGRLASGEVDVTLPRGRALADLEEVVRGLLRGWLPAPSWTARAYVREDS